MFSIVCSDVLLAIKLRLTVIVFTGIYTFFLIWKRDSLIIRTKKHNSLDSSLSLINQAFTWIERCCFFSDWDSYLKICNVYFNVKEALIVLLLLFIYIACFKQQKILRPGDVWFSKRCLQETKTMAHRSIAWQIQKEIIRIYSTS